MEKIFLINLAMCFNLNMAEVIMSETRTGL